MFLVFDLVSIPVAMSTSGDGFLHGYLTDIPLMTPRNVTLFTRSGGDGELNVVLFLQLEMCMLERVEAAYSSIIY